MVKRVFGDRWRRVGRMVVAAAVVAVGVPVVAPAGAAVDGTVIVAHAVGATGEERLAFEIDGVAQATVQVTNTGSVWSSGTPTVAYTYTHPDDVDPGRIRVAFVNNGLHDGQDMNLRIPIVEVDGRAFATDADDIESRGTWANGSRCRVGFYRSSVLACDGWLQLPDVDPASVDPVADEPVSEAPVDGEPVDAADDDEAEEGPVDDDGSDGDAETAIVVVARGATGEERLELQIGGETVATWVVGRAATGHPFTVEGTVGPDDVRVAFTNDAVIAGRDRNVQVDAVIIDGVRYESEHPSVRSKGVWANGARCREGVFSADLLACNGWFQYAAIDGVDQPEPVDRDDAATTEDDGADDEAEPVDPTTPDGEEVEPVDAPTPDDEEADDERGAEDEREREAPAEEGAGSELVVRAIGHTGTEQLAVEIDGVEVDRFVLTRSSGSFWGGDDWRHHTYRHPAALAAGQVRLVFDNNGITSSGDDRNLRVDHIRIDGHVFETEDPAVVSEGSWGRGSQCGSGSFGNDNLACDGYIQYHGDQPVRSGGSPVIAGARVATLGDSNTASGYWRWPLQQRLNEADCTIDLVGRARSGWGDLLDIAAFDADTDASSGATIATFRNPANAVFVHGAATLATDPDLVIVTGGTNDLLGLDLDEPDDRAVIEDVVAAVVDQLADAVATAPSARFVVVSIPPIRGQEAEVAAFNRLLAAEVADLGASVPVRHVAVDVADSDLGSDGVHLTVDGGARLGWAIAEAVVDDLTELGAC
ncbi:MAG: carbohydrate-binding domain-containing protein [Actinomycetota bacterium]